MVVKRSLCDFELPGEIFDGKIAGTAGFKDFVRFGLSVCGLKPGTNFPYLRIDRVEPRSLT